MKVLLTGVAGFLGFHITRRLLDSGDLVVGIDNLNNYYDISLKNARLKLLESKSFKFIKMDTSDPESLEKLFNDNNNFDLVLHMAAQAGVGYSAENPQIYVQSNLVGFANMLEFCRRAGVRHFVYASSSTVYGLNSKLPFVTTEATNTPISFYGATKKANELMAHSYSYLHGIRTTGLRFFTMYGPWGRPDMAYFKFVRAIVNGEAINVYGDGSIKRDFTYVDDAVESVMRLIDPVRSVNNPSYQIYNVGNNDPVSVINLIRMLEMLLEKKVKINFLPVPKSDLPETHADITELTKVIGFSPSIKLNVGMQKFIGWYKEYMGIL